MHLDPLSALQQALLQARQCVEVAGPHANDGASSLLAASGAAGVPQPGPDGTIGPSLAAVLEALSGGQW